MKTSQIQTTTMCIICTGDYDNTLTELNCHWCSTITEIPETLTNVTTLYCYHTKVTTIPDTLTNLTILSCSYTKVTTIPDTLTNLTTLYCGDTNVTTIPDTLTNLTTLSCYNTKVTTIPDTLTKLEHRLPKYNVKLLKKFQTACKRRRIKKSNILFVMHEDLVRHIIIPML
jgi:Leucine-rich repeat (LRR) protein